MIKLLSINNIALVPSLELELEAGLTLLTGETGTGKSILIDALGLLLGERASPDLIRTGEERGEVQAVVESAPLHAALPRYGLPDDADEIILRREIHATGKGKATVNGALVPVSVLRELAPHLATIHGQHEPQGLLDPASHLELLDHHAGLQNLVAEVAERFRRRRDVEGALEALRRDRAERERRRDMLEYQSTEILKASLQVGEEEELLREKRLQASAGRLASLSSEAYAILYEDEAAVVAQLGLVYRKVEELGAIDPRFAPHLEARQAVRAAIEDLALFLRDYRERLEVSPGRLDEIESRLALIERLKRKYGATVDETLAFAARARGELEEMGAPQERERALEAEKAALTEAYLASARKVSRERRARAPELERKVQSELSLLAMEKTRFRVRFTPEEGPREPTAEPPPSSSWTEKGVETAEFLLSPNPGEDLRPLARIASGGELSRIMLALKSVIGVDTPGKTLVFDEVDAGIGGRVAEVVGRKLRAMAARHQVLCVTHLPQIASQADHHLVARKGLERGRTVTTVKRLGPEERVEELARMLGGERVTESARRHAREMVKQNLRP